MDLTPPETDEIEISVFGRGYGEAICTHLGEGEWAVIDSCINPNTGVAAALSYLEALDLIPRDVVRLVVATHWDDDHIRGLGNVVQASPLARVACSAALQRREIFAFVVQQEAAGGASSSGVDEFRRILRFCAERGHSILWAKANLPLHPLPPGDDPRVVALSPSEDAYERSIESLIEAATASKVTRPRRYRAPEGPNGASVATFIRNEEVAILAGADLEVSPNKETGWDGVLSYSKPAMRASLIKVPHHGSQNAHHNAVWTEMLDKDAVAILTPWRRGAKFLPTEDDLNRLRAIVQERLFLTAVPKIAKSKADSDLAKMIRRLHGEGISELQGWGHVRARRKRSSGEWHVDLDGDAVAVN